MVALDEQTALIASELRMWGIKVNSSRSIDDKWALCEIGRLTDLSKIYNRMRNSSIYLAGAWRQVDPEQMLRFMAFRLVVQD